MGNTIEPEIRTKMVKVLDDIFAIECPILDIEKRQGNTGYIDFIKPDELGDSDIVKGVDCNGRRFIVFKSKIILHHRQIECFTTFFKRFPEDSCVTYHTAGHYGRNVFFTDGGASLGQIELLYDLLMKKAIELTYEDLRRNRFVEFFYFEKEQIEKEQIVEIEEIEKEQIEKEEIEKKEQRQKEEKEEYWNLIKNMIGVVKIGYNSVI